MRKTSRISIEKSIAEGALKKTGLEVKMSRPQTALKAVFYNTSSPCNRKFRSSGQQQPCVAFGRSQLQSLLICNLAQFYLLTPDKFQAKA
jgi:hypothetical protein